MKRLRLTATLLCAALLMIPCITSSARTTIAETKTEQDTVTFHFLNVNSIEKESGGPIGSADCTIIEDHGVITVVDVGTKYKTSTDYITAYLKDLGVSKIDHLFVTHPHDDHLGGVPNIVKAFDVVNYYYTTLKDWSHVRPCEMDWDTKYYYDAAMRAVTEKINSDGTAVNLIVPDEEGKVYKISDDSSFTVYNSKAVVENNYTEFEFNDMSMMMKYTYKGVSALITGDINRYRGDASGYEYTLTGEVDKNGNKVAAGSENAIAPVGDIHILKVAHHGTEGSLHTEDLLSKINPSKKAYAAVITGYRSNIGASVIGRLNKYGYDVKVTHDGDVTVTTDGTNIEMNQVVVE